MKRVCLSLLLAGIAHSLNASAGPSPDLLKKAINEAELETLNSQKRFFQTLQKRDIDIKRHVETKKVLVDMSETSFAGDLRSDLNIQ